MATPRPRVDVSSDLGALAQRVAHWIVDLACAAPGRFAIALSGGSTPKPIYRLLAAPPLREAMPWHRVHLFWGDERFVPWDDPDSNYRMARESMIDLVPIPAENVHGIEFIGQPADAARAYERVLKSYYRGDTLDPARPLFDISLLGMGADGHTASLIPGQPVIEEKQRWVAEVLHGRPEPRITLTYPALDSSRSACFVVAGADKEPAMRRARDGDPNLPAARMSPVGELVWFVDLAAYGKA